MHIITIMKLFLCPKNFSSLYKGLDFNLLPYKKNVLFIPCVWFISNKDYYYYNYARHKLSNMVINPFMAPLPGSLEAYFTIFFLKYEQKWSSSNSIHAG